MRRESHQQKPKWLSNCNKGSDRKQQPPVEPLEDLDLGGKKKKKKPAAKAAESVKEEAPPAQPKEEEKNSEGE